MEHQDPEKQFADAMRYLIKSLVLFTQACLKARRQLSSKAVAAPTSEEFIKFLLENQKTLEAFGLEYFYLPQNGDGQISWLPTSKIDQEWLATGTLPQPSPSCRLENRKWEIY